MSENIRVQDVSDTALWVATYRAKESERPDALFRDPLAKRLSGDRGQKIAELLGSSGIMYWVMVIRTIAIDRLILKAIDLGVDTVVNLGAGLDTRPYRMKLPKQLKWVEVDFPNMIDFKTHKLKGETPVCQLERMSVDLSKEAARKAVFQKIGDASSKVLIITEGVIPYLANDDAESLAKAIHAVPSFRYWIQDFSDLSLRRRSPRSFRKHLKDAPFQFRTHDWLGFFTKLGFKVNEIISAVDQSREIARPFPIPFPWNVLFNLQTPKMKKKWYENFNKRMGYVLFEKS